MMQSLTVLGEELRVDGVFADRLDELPLDRADHRHGGPHRVLLWTTTFLHVVHVRGVHLDDRPGADSVLVDMNAHRLLKAAYDDADLQGLGEHGRRHRAGFGGVHSDSWESSKRVRHGAAATKYMHMVRLI